MSDSQGKSPLFDSLSDFRKVRSGGEATVYRAKKGEDFVAFKWMREAGEPNAEWMDFFKAHHFDGAAKIDDAGTLDGRPYTVMEYVRGISSAEASPVPPRVAVKIMRKMVETLTALSAENVFHGDLGPENVLLDLKARPVLIDFGIRGLGTPRFAAPERFEGKSATEKSELFSLGALLYFWLSGEPLFGGDSLSAVESAVFDVEACDVSLLLHGRGKVSPETVGVFAPIWKGTLRRNPDDRFEDFDELDECLEIAESRLGELSLDAEREALWQSDLQMRIREKEEALDASEEVFPFKPADPAESETNRSETKFPGGKFLIGLAVFLVLAALLVFIFVGEPSSPNVENVGKSMLENSRSGRLSEESFGAERESSGTFRGVVSDADSAEEE